MRAKLRHIREVCGDIVQSLPGTSHHNSGSGLETDALQRGQAAQAVVARHAGRMQLSVMEGVNRLLTQQIARRPGTEKRLVGGVGPFAERERDSSVRPMLVDSLHHGAHRVTGEIRILPSLEHESAHPGGICRSAAVEYLPGSERIPLQRPVVAAYAAVEAVVATAVGYLDQGTHIDATSEDSVGETPRLLTQRRKVACRHIRIKKFPIFPDGRETPRLREAPHKSYEPSRHSSIYQ